MQQRIAWIGSGAVATLAIVAACGAAWSPQNNTPANTDPTQGWAQVWPDDPNFQARCDRFGVMHYTRDQLDADGYSTVSGLPVCAPK